MLTSFAEILGTVFSIFGAYKLGDMKPNVLKTNAFFGIGNIFLLSYFVYNADWLMVLLQSVYLICAVRAIVNAIKKRRVKKALIENQQSKHLKVNIF